LLGGLLLSFKNFNYSLLCNYSKKADRANSKSHEIIFGVYS
jgi:hypothetical protein